MSELLPCPFCGTSLTDPDKPASELHGGGFTFECGGCGATWPPIQREDAETLDDEGIAAFFNRRAPSPSPAPGVVEALTAAKDFIALEYADARQEQYGEWLAPEARKVFGLICEALASLSQPAKGEREGGRLDDAVLSDRLKEIAVEVFPSANKHAVADGVKNIVRILERIDPAEYVVLHRSMYPFSYSAPDADDGQPDEAQEWHDYDPDC